MALWYMSTSVSSNTGHCQLHTPYSCWPLYACAGAIPEYMHVMRREAPICVEEQCVWRRGRGGHLPIAHSSCVIEWHVGGV